jgi:hypothetical protein
LHPQFARIYDLLRQAVDSRLIRKVKIDTNGTLPIPSLMPHDNIRFGGASQRKKAHLPYLWSPMDLGEPVPKQPCSMPRLCGFSLDNRGWLPCSAAIMIVRAFGLTHLYRQEMPTKPWGITEICRHCVHSMPEEWKQEHCKPLADITEEEKTPSESWREALVGDIR